MKWSKILKWGIPILLFVLVVYGLYSTAQSVKYLFVGSDKKADDSVKINSGPGLIGTVQNIGDWAAGYWTGLYKIFTGK